MVHERDSRLCNNLYVNGVQAASRSSMNLVLSGSSGPFRIQVASGWMRPVPRVTLRVIAVISHDIALVSRAVSFHTQPAELELTMPSFTRWVCMGCQQPNRHGVPGPGPRVFCWLPVCCQQLCMQQVEQGLAPSHSRVQAERPWCLWRRGRRGLAFQQRNYLTCYITTWI